MRSPPRPRGTLKLILGRVARQAARSPIPRRSSQLRCRSFGLARKPTCTTFASTRTAALAAVLLRTGRLRSARTMSSRCCRRLPRRSTRFWRTRASCSSASFWAMCSSCKAASMFGALIVLSPWSFASLLFTHPCVCFMPPPSCRRLFARQLAGRAAPRHPRGLLQLRARLHGHRAVRAHGAATRPRLVRSLACSCCFCNRSTLVFVVIGRPCRKACIPKLKTARWTMLSGGILVRALAAPPPPHSAACWSPMS